VAADAHAANTPLALVNAASRSARRREIKCDMLTSV
jgi:hypothetical protein